jgi:aminoglycoside phosphotransferase (APT) family kinase protein
MPAAEVSVDDTLVRSLLRAQYPALADLPLTPMPAHGWDNTMYLLGDEFTVRLPRRAAASGLVEHECRWLPPLSRKLTMPTPVPIHSGTPTADYPWHWSVNRLLRGEPIGVGAFTDPLVSAQAIARFLHALHQPAPLEAPVNPYRGVPLASRRRLLREGLGELRGSGLDVEAASERWERLARAPRYRGYWHWVHGDLHGGNILVMDGWLTGVIDFGDLTRGDPATDFAVAWLLFDDPAHREPLRTAALAHGRGTWQRAQAWAISWGVAALSRSADNPLIEAIGERALRNALA